MSVDLKFINNYDKLKQEFRKDTKLDPDKNVSEYIVYFNARVNDMTYQFHFQLANRYLNEISDLPSKIGRSVAQALKDAN